MKEVEENTPSTDWADRNVEEKGIKEIKIERE